MNQSKIFVLSWTEDETLASCLLYAGMDETEARDVNKFIGIHPSIFSSVIVDNKISSGIGHFEIQTFENGKKISIEDTSESKSLKDIKWRSADIDTLPINEGGVSRYEY